MPVKTTGSSSARAAYKAADNPAGPAPNIKTFTYFSLPLVDIVHSYLDEIRLMYFIFSTITRTMPCLF
jgi:hypothetical protein